MNRPPPDNHFFRHVNLDPDFHINAFVEPEMAGEEELLPPYYLINPGEGEFMYRSAEEFFRDAREGKIPGYDKRGNPIKEKKRKRRRRSKEKRIRFSYRKPADVIIRLYYTRSVARRLRKR
uniref:AGC-kinase C-terminal domain-containing protein n=2 Tax=Caenorhabditis tropicalis TaxID=1561998 RepID=A0A1I7TR61_9PELO